MEKKPIRILQVVANMNLGGIETMLMNHFRALDKSKIVFDFIVHTPSKCAYEDEIKLWGGQIFRAPAIRPWTYPKYFKWLNEFFSNNACNYAAVHGHMQENSGIALYYAKKYGISNRLMSSHIAPMHIDFKYPFRKFAKIYCHLSSPVRLACGIDAGKHLYGNKSFIVMHNAIDSKRFIFDVCRRQNIRRLLGIKDNEIVIGHVGRFNPQKNHRFLVKVAAEAIKRNKNLKFLLVGDGYLIDEIKSQVEVEGINNNVIFLGNRRDIDFVLQGFDVFFMPSLYEGLPVSVIEAQAAGLPCVLTDTIDKDSDITGRISFMSLTQSIDDWRIALEDAAEMGRADTQSMIKKAGYDVNENLKTLLPLYGVEAL